MQTQKHGGLQPLHKTSKNGKNKFHSLAPPFMAGWKPTQTPPTLLIRLKNRNGFGFLLPRVALALAVAQGLKQVKRIFRH